MKYIFTCDGKDYEVEKRYLSGAEIREILKIDSDQGLFLAQEVGQDRYIEDTDSVDLKYPIELLTTPHASY